MSRRSCYLFLSLFIAGCANQAPPGGGPEDKTAPKILWTIPKQDSVRVGRRTEIQIAFSEAMNQAATEKAIYISPYSPPSFSWKKNILTMTLKDSLEADRTCVITVGTDSKDRHSNPLVQSYSFAFSTGGQIDQGTISGRVVSEYTKRISIWSYRTGNQRKLQADSMICRKRADYITQVGEGGRYQLSYLAQGVYRVFAVVDQDEDFLYTPTVDIIGIASKDIVLSSESMSSSHVDFMLFQEDTSRSVIQSLSPLGTGIVSLRLNHPLRGNTYFEGHGNADSVRSHIRISDSLGVAVPIRDAYVNTNDLSEIRILVDSQNANMNYTLEIFNVVDQKGDTLRSDKFSFHFDAEHVPKTHVELTAPPVKTDPVLPNDVFSFRLDNGVRRNLFEKYFLMTDSASRPVRGVFRWQNSSAVTFYPAALFGDRMAYQIALRTDSIMDWSGQTVSDTAMRWHFTSFKTDSLGTVSGIITDEDSSRSGAFVLTCHSLNQASREYKTEIAKPGRFVINYVIPGKYDLIAYRDEDGNGKYSNGRVIPITFSERFTSYSDTVAVRPNWETSGIVIHFKK
jgi:hypothetical protein